MERDGGGAVERHLNVGASPLWRHRSPSALCSSFSAVALKVLRCPGYSRSATTFAVFFQSLRHPPEYRLPVVTVVMDDDNDNDHARILKFTEPCPAPTAAARNAVSE